MVNHYRYDFIGLSSESKPTPTTSEKVADGSTFYESNTSKLYVWYKDQWYEKEGGGSYELPTASSDTLGGVKVGDNLAINSETGVLSGNYSAFTGTDGTDAGTAGLVPAPTASDADKYLKSDGTWATFSGGGPTVVQTTGDSTTDVMSQNATTGLVFSDVNNKKRVTIGYNTTSNADGQVTIGSPATNNSGTSSLAIGYNAYVSGSYAMAIGTDNPRATGARSTAIGKDATASADGAVAIGTGANAQTKGEFNIGTGNASYGYHNTNYRILTGVHNGLNLHDAATVAQGNTLSSSAPTTSTVGALGQLYTDITNMHTYQCTEISGSTYTWTQRW